MAVLKIANAKTTKHTTAATSSNVSSSVSGNMDLIQYQINQKSNDYINVKNAVRILDQYSNWNGYIKIYTEVENNFNVDDIVYITYTEPDDPDPSIFNLENPSNFDDPFDENGLPISNFYLGYKVLYTNKFKNEIVINRYYNDIPSDKLLKNQFLSKVSCRGGNFYNDIADGVVFYDCNIFDGQFGSITGLVLTPYQTGTTTISGATIICVGLLTTSNINGEYRLNVPSGVNLVKCYAPGYITKSLFVNVSVNVTSIYDILMLSGTNSITIFADDSSITIGALVNFTSTTVGYDEPVNYQWKINDLNFGTNNSTFSYNLFADGDIVTCEVSDDFGTTVSNSIVMSVVGTTTSTSTSTTTTSTTTTTTTTPTPVISYSFGIKYAHYAADACNGTTGIIYSLISTPVVGTILYKDSNCVYPWDIQGFVLFITPALFGNQVAAVSIVSTPYAVGEIITLSGFYCTPYVPFVLGFDSDGFINLKELGSNVISIGLSGKAIASQSWINCDFPAAGFANFSYYIGNKYITGYASESSATSSNPDPSNYDIDSYIFTGITSSSSISRIIDFNNDAQYCGDGWGTVELYITSLTVTSGPGGVTLGTDDYIPVTPPVLNVDFDFDLFCSPTKISVDTFIGGSGVYQVSTTPYPSYSGALFGTFVDDNYSQVYLVSNGTYYIAVRDKNNHNNIKIKSMTINCP